MKKRIVSMMLAAVCCMGMLTGCVTSTESTAKTSGTEEGKQTETAQKEAGAAELDESTLNIYTALEDEQVAEYLEDFREKYPDVTINITRDSTGIITAKLLAEKDNPQADVVWGLSAASLLVLDGEDMLEGYAPKGVDRILPEFKDASETPKWVGIDAWETAFLVNKEVLKCSGKEHRDR